MQCLSTPNLSSSRPPHTRCDVRKPLLQCKQRRGQQVWTEYIRYYMQLMRQPPTIDSVQRGASLYVEGGGTTHAHTHDCTRTHTRTHARTHACTHTHTRTHAHAQTHKHMHTRTHTHAQTHADQLTPTPQTLPWGGGGIWWNNTRWEGGVPNITARYTPQRPPPPCHLNERIPHQTARNEKRVEYQ